MKNFIKIDLCFLDFFVLFLLFNQISSNSYSDTLEIVAQFNITRVKISENNIQDCEKCMPAGIKLSSNGTIFCSFPRWFENVTTSFAKYNPKGQYFEPWPSLEMNQRYINFDPTGINSVLGFEIDLEDNIYILDQGKVNNHEALDGSIKLLKFSLQTGALLKEYKFNCDMANYTNSFLNDVVIDQKKEVAYIADSGLALDGKITHYQPGILVLNLTSSEVHRILSNHYSVNPDETFWLHVDNQPVNRDSPMLTGADGIALSCDGETLYYCPLTGRMLYSVLTKDIEEAIKSGKTNDINVYQGYKKEASDGLLASSKGNLYISGIESGSVYIANEIEPDLLRFNYKDFDGYVGNTSSMWPDTLAIYDGYLYFMSNQLNNFPNDINYTHPKNGKYNFAIMRFSVGNDESYLKGCTGFGNEWGVGTIIVWICFAVIVLIVLSFVLMGSNSQEDVIDKHMNMKED